MKIIKLDLNYPSLAGNNDNGDADDNDLGQQKALQTVKYNPALQMTIKLRPSAGLSTKLTMSTAGQFHSRNGPHDTVRL